MKKYCYVIIPLLVLPLLFTGCSTVSEKTASFSIIYGAAATISLLLLIGCLLFVRKNKRWFVLLFSSVLVVNSGYTFLSLSPNLETALWANRIAYLGSVFLPLAMLMIIFNLTNTKTKKWVSISLLATSVVVFLIAASPGILNIYYKEVSFQIIDGVSSLVKVYGPLHPLYLVYLLGYFSSMVAVIVRASVKKTISTPIHAIVVATAVFVNIGVWFIEQISNIDFEFLSVSYIISELFLLGVHLVMNENQRLLELVKQKDEALSKQHSVPKKSQTAYNFSKEEIELYTHGLNTLTQTERQIYDLYVNGMSTKEILTQLNIKENTLKFHNKNLYGKLGVTSRKHLIAFHQAINSNTEK